MELKPLEAQKQNPLSFLIAEYSPYPVYRRIVDFLQPADIITVSRTCKALSTLYPNLLSTDWDLDRALRRYTDDPKRFRSALNSCKAVIAGSFVLDFFDRNVTDASQLEIYLGAYAADRLEPQDYVDWIADDDGEPTKPARKNNCDRLFQHLTSIEGYFLVEGDHLADDDAFSHRTSGHVVWHTETLARPGSAARLRLSSPSTKRWDDDVSDRRRRDYEVWDIEKSSRRATIGNLLDQLTSTAAANFIFDASAVCMFPSLTFTHRTALPTFEPVYLDLDYGQSAPALTRRHILAKQDFFPTLSPDTLHTWNTPLNRMRVETWLGYTRPLAGPCSWTIPLAMHGVEPGPLPPCILDATRIDVTVGSELIPASHDVEARYRPRRQQLLIQWAVRQEQSLRYYYTSPLSRTFGYNFGTMSREQVYGTLLSVYGATDNRRAEVLSSEHGRRHPCRPDFNNSASSPSNPFDDSMMPGLVSQAAASSRSDMWCSDLDRRIQIPGLNPRLNWQSELDRPATEVRKIE